MLTLLSQDSLPYEFTHTCFENIALVLNVLDTLKFILGQWNMLRIFSQDSLPQEFTNNHFQNIALALRVLAA